MDQCETKKVWVERFRASGRNHLGAVYAASGETRFRPQAMPFPLCNMDWALIKIGQNRIGDNTATLTTSE